MPFTKEVDTAAVVTIGVLRDATDLDTPETGIAYNAAGMDIDIIEETQASTTSTAITPTTSGANDWAHIARGVYSLEITAAQLNTPGSLRVVMKADACATAEEFYSVIDPATADKLALLVGTLDASGLLTSASFADSAKLALAPDVLEDTTIATLANQTSFTLTAGSADDDAYKGQTAVIVDSATNAQRAVATIQSYVGSTKTVTLVTDPGIFTMAVGDSIQILAAGSLNIPLSEPSAVPDWSTSTIVDALNFITALLLNPQIATPLLVTLRNYADSSDIATAAISDTGGAGGTFRHEKWA